VFGFRLCCGAKIQKIIKKKVIFIPETKQQALKRAKKEGFEESSLEEGEKGWYIIPHGITNAKARRAYVHARDKGNNPQISASIAWNIQKINDKRKEK
jgi:hypothetical protein